MDKAELFNNYVKILVDNNYIELPNNGNIYYFTNTGMEQIKNKIGHFPFSTIACLGSCDMVSLYIKDINSFERIWLTNNLEISYLKKLMETTLKLFDLSLDDEYDEYIDLDDIIV